MSIEGITDLEIINGIFITIFVVVSMIVGLKISFKYSDHKIKELITVGLSWMLLFTHWWGNSFSFLLYLFFGYRMELSMYLFIENMPMPLALFLWLYSFCSLMYPRFLKKVISISLPLCLIEGILILIVLLINPEILGTMMGMFDTRSSIFLLTLKISNALIFAMTGFIYGVKLIFEGDKIIQLKGIFLLIGIISFITGGFSSMFIFTLLELTFIRLLLISSSIEFYLSFFLPKCVAHLLIKEKK